MSLDFPPIYVLPTNLQPDELHSLEERIPSLTWNPHEAEILLGRITRPERARFELRRLKLETEEIRAPAQSVDNGDEQPSKRQRTSGPEGGGGRSNVDDGGPQGSQKAHSATMSSSTIKVVKLSWLLDSLDRGVVLPTEGYILYEGRKLPAASEKPTTIAGTPTRGSPARSILKRAAADKPDRPGPAANPASPRTRQQQTRRYASPAQRPPLLHETTSEHDLPLPPVPDFLHTSYSCQRPTTVDAPNAAFVEELKEIRTLRLLEGDKVGVRAYSTSIAAVAAYPYPLQTSAEVSRLPGCDVKIARLYDQWRESGQLEDVASAATDTKMCVLKLFYGIWGVGDVTAREFYSKGWRDLDDLVEYGWGDLSRVQQIGVKYYDEFLLKIPRAEVEEIGDVILSHARRVDPGFQMTIVGGYRRGKAQSGDVDVVLSHPDESRTLHLVEKIVVGLEKSEHITHTLTLSTRNSDRKQEPLPWKGEGRAAGTGFDTLDKALVVWKDPSKRDAPHRRVDIIISPWRTVGCAVLGWSGGTTFQRDLRRYCKKEKGLKFDSSGVRSRTDGSWMDLEGARSEHPARDTETAEKRVFEGLGLVWRRPEERCTG